MRNVLLLLVASICFSVTSSFANENKELERFLDQESKEKEKRYTTISLKSLPTDEDRKKLEEKGIYLLRYISGTTYYALVTKDYKKEELLSTRSSELPIEFKQPDAHFKLGPFLAEDNIPDYAYVKDGIVRVIAAYFPGVQKEAISEFILANQLQDFLLLEDFHMFYINIPEALIFQLAEKSWIRRVECISPPEELFNIEGRTMNRVQKLSSKGVGGRALTGKGVSVGIWDSNIEAHPDLGKRLITKQFFSTSPHGQHVSGTMAGSGLIDFKARGMAPGATIYGWNFNEKGGSTALEMLTSVRKHDVVVTQNSYGVKQKHYCKSPRKYDLSDEQLDLLVNYFPYLTHVFSAGNDQYACTGESSYASSTKRAKNIILVGAVDKLAQMSDFSSWGPMDDGRILPHIVANGVDIYSTVYNNLYEQEGWQGTSMACPAISGLTTLLYERYRQLNDGENPLAALIKGALLNSAEDLGNKGPDYQYGFGRADGERAVEVLENKQYYIGKIKHGEIKNYQIEIPKGATALQVMLVWTDKEGKVSDKALVNDLNLKVKSGANEYLPWILNPSEPAASAKRGIDKINNQEQITIENPQTSYTIEIKAHKIPEEEQEYVVVYSYLMPDLRIIYPNGGENFQPGEEIVARWNTNGYKGVQILQLSTDGGMSFENLASNISEDIHEVSFVVPEALTNKAILRIIQAGTMDVSDYAFTIMPRPKNLKLLASRCSNSGWKLKWDAVGGAAKYKVLKANLDKESYVELGETRGLSYELPELDASGKNIYSVKAVSATGIVSERAYAVIANSSGTLPITEASLPFSEEFQETPSPFVEIEKGKNIKQAYQQLTATQKNPSKKGHLLVFYGDDNTAKWNEADVYSNVDNVSNAKICNIDASSITGKLWMRLGLLMKTSAEGNANFRVLIDDQPRTNNAGQENITSVKTGEVVKYYNLLDKAGKEFSINFQSALRNQKDSVSFSFIQIYEAKHDVGVLSVQVPEPNGDLTSKEPITVKLKNYNGEEISDVPIQLYVDGKLVAEEIIKGPIAAFKSTSYTFNNKANFSLPDKLYEVKVIVKLDGDVNDENNEKTAKTANLGDYYRIPKMVSYFSERKSVTSEVLRFTDDGAKILNYSNGFKGSVIFKPSTSGQKVKIKFTEFDTQESYDELTIYDGEYNSSKVLAVLSGTLSTPMEFISSARDGSLLVQFKSSNSINRKGWLAEVTETSEKPKKESVNNTLSLDRIPNRNGYFSEPQIIYAELVNNTNKAIEKVRVQYRINGGSWSVVETIPSIAAGKMLRYGFKKKADITESPKEYTIEVKILNKDAYLEDNIAKKAITNDRYCSVKSGFSVNYSQLYITKVAKGDVSNTTSQFGQESSIPQYFRDVKFILYKDKKDNNLEVTVNTDAQKGAIGLWIDWNNDGDFEDSGENIGSTTVSAGKATYELPIKFPQTIKAADYNARVRATTGNIANICQSDSYGKNGEIEDYTITVKEHFPYAKDLELVETSLKGGENLSREEVITVTISNKGIKDISEFEMAYSINGGAEVKEKVNMSLAVGETKPYTFTKKADFSKGGAYEVKIWGLLASDINNSNDVLTVTIINEVVAEDGFFALHFDGKDDIVNLGTLGEQKLESYTFEAWIKPESYGAYGKIGFGRLFEGKGPTIFLCGAGHSFYPENSLIISKVGGGTFMSSANSITLNKWQHVAVTYDNDKTVKLYINGKEVQLNTYKEITTAQENNATYNLFIGNRTDYKRGFSGMMDEVRIWNKVCSSSDIISGMYKHQKGKKGLVAEFSLDEGYFNSKVYSGELRGTISNADLDESEESIWVEPTKLLDTIYYPGQVTAWQEDGNNMKAEVEKTVDLSRMIASFVTTWPNTKVEVNAAPQISGTTPNDFRNSETSPVSYDLSTTVFGNDLSENYQLTLKKEASTACDLLKLTIPELNFTAKQPIAEKITFKVAEDKDLNSLPMSFEVSQGAKAWIVNREIQSGVSLDFSKPIAIKVVAANGRASKEYSINIQKSQRIVWNPTDAERSKIYGDAAFELTAVVSSGSRVHYTSSDKDILTIVNGKAQIKGAGQVKITANTHADNSNAAAEPITQVFTVNKKKLIIKAEDKEVDYLLPIPELTMAFEGFVYGENSAVLKELPVIATKAVLGSKAGTYTISLRGGADANYHYELQEGVLTIKPTDAQDITFVVSHLGAPDEGAVIVVAEQTITTTADGKAQIKLNPGTYTYSVKKEGREPYLGTIVVGDASRTIKVALTEPLPIFTVNFTTDGNGTLKGKLVQHIKQGKDGTAVTAEPKLGYEFDKWNDGTKSATYIAKSVQGDATYLASFKTKTYTLNYKAGLHGHLEGEVMQTVSFGKSGGFVKVVANKGYSFKRWSDGRKDNPRKDDKVSQNMTVTAEYEKTYTLPYTQTFDKTGLPEDWQVVDNAEGGCVWTFKEKSKYYSADALKNSNPNTAIMDAYDCGYSVKKNADLISPNFDFSKNSEVSVTFNHNYKKGFSPREEASFSYKINDGDWIEIRKFKENVSNNTIFKATIEALAGKKNVRFKWTLKEAFYFWAVDDFKITGSNAASEYVVLYRAGKHGYLEGADAQGIVQATVAHGEQGPKVLAVADKGYAFYRWSDGVTENPRQENVVKMIDVTAEFGSDCSAIKELPYREDFDAKKQAPDCWVNPESQPGKFKWEFGVLSSYGVPYALGTTGNNAYFNSSKTNYGQRESADLISPEFDLTGYETVYLSFKHLHVTYGDSKVSVSYSIDGGQNWKEIKVWTTTIGQLELFNQKIEAVAGKKQVKFKWNSTAKWQFGWIIDDIELKTNPTYLLHYEASGKYDEDKNWIAYGAIEGEAVQSVDKGNDGKEVKAIAASGYEFVKWSDGRTDNPRTDKNVSANVSVVAEFAKQASITYTLSYSAGSGGTVSGTTQQKVKEGASGSSITAVANDGYEFVKWSDGRTDNPRTDKDVSANVSVVAEFAKQASITYTLSYSAGSGGTVSGTTQQKVKEGASGSSITAVANDGYEFVKWSDGRTDNPRTDKDVSANVSVVAEFAKQASITYTLSYSAGSGGTVSGTTQQKVKEGASGSSITAVANDGYEFVKWSDGRTDNPRTDKNVSANVSVVAEFSIQRFSLNYTTDGNGSIEGAANQNIDYGKSGSSIRAVANDGYKFVKWSDGRTDNPRTDKDVSANVSVVAEFSIQRFSLNYTTDGNGSIEGAENQNIDYGKSGSSITAVANDGYKFVKWSDGRTDNPRTDKDVRANVSVVAEFSIQRFSLNYTTDGNGSIEGVANQNIDYGKSGSSIRAVANDGYKFVKWSDGRTDNPRTDKDVRASVSVVAEFKMEPDLHDDKVAMLVSDRTVEIDILANDKNLTKGYKIEITSQPANGELTLNSDETVTYRVKPNYEGEDSFTYRVCNIDNICKEANVSIIVNKANSFGAVIPAQILTPNGDGENEKWCLPELEKRVLSGIGNFVRIFNTKGEEVYYKKNYMMDAECFSGNALKAGGYNDGQRLPDGIYFYVIEVEDGYKRKGFLYIIR